MHMYRFKEGEFSSSEKDIPIYPAHFARCCSVACHVTAESPNIGIHFSEVTLTRNMSEEVQASFALDDDLVILILRQLDYKTRASLACVSKTWRSCVRSSWNKIHLCFASSEETLRAQLTWLAHQLRDHPLLLQTLELHSSTPTPTSGDRRLPCCHQMPLRVQ